ncbi:MAG: hypothetical protein ACXWEA_02470 [Solirubrobacterales bacterium]
MKWALALVLGVVAAAAVLAYFVFDPFADDSDPSQSRGLSGTACQRLAGLAGQLAEEDTKPSAFLIALGRDAAGIRPGRRALADLARGGRNRIPGRGFQHRFDDGTRGQVRHFVGLSVATMYGGASPIRWISEHLRNDPAGTPDGRLGDEGIAFSTQLIRGELSPQEASGWVLSHLCRRQPG